MHYAGEIVFWLTIAALIAVPLAFGWFLCRIAARSRQMEQHESDPYRWGL